MNKFNKRHRKNVEQVIEVSEMNSLYDYGFVKDSSWGKKYNGDKEVVEDEVAVVDKGGNKQDV